MKIECFWEHNGEDTLLYAGSLPGAYTRGESLETALRKMDREAISYLRWTGAPNPERIAVEIVQERVNSLEIRDADSNVLFESEKAPLSFEEYAQLKALALKSAEDFLARAGQNEKLPAGSANLLWTGSPDGGGNVHSYKERQ